VAAFDDHEGIDGIVCVVPAGYEDRASRGGDEIRSVESFARCRSIETIGEIVRRARVQIGPIVGAIFVASLVVLPNAFASTHRQAVDPFSSGWSATKDSGYCSSAATSTKRADAFRCYRGSYQILDPCFSSPAANGVVRCVAAPWTRKSVELQLTKPLPAGGQGVESFWAVTLANGGNCTISPETTDVSYAHVVGWVCTNGELAQGLHSGKSWYALWQPSSGVRWKHIAIRTLYR
jgi:hypothetical protein